MVLGHLVTTGSITVWLGIYRFLSLFYLLLGNFLSPDFTPVVFFLLIVCMIATHLCIRGTGQRSDPPVLEFSSLAALTLSLHYYWAIANPRCLVHNRSPTTHWTRESQSHSTINRLPSKRCLFRLVWYGCSIDHQVNLHRFFVLTSSHSPLRHAGNPHFQLGGGPLWHQRYSIQETESPRLKYCRSWFFIFLYHYYLQVVFAFRNATQGHRERWAWGGDR